MGSLPPDTDKRGTKSTSTMAQQIALLVLSSIALTLSQESGNSLDVSIGDILGETEVSSNGLEVIEGKANPDVLPLNPPQQPQPQFNRNPYVNTFQRTQQPLGSRPAYSHNNLDIIGYGGQGQVAQNQRPTIDSLNSYAASQGKSVTTPEELLDMCCQFPACYDPLYELCIDTCRKCETVYPVTSWLPCPPLLNIPDCTSPNLSWMGALPLVCYPDIGPFGAIIPLESISHASQSYGGQSGRAGGAGGGSGQAYREAIRSGNRKQCSERGICHSESNQGSMWG